MLFGKRKKDDHDWGASDLAASAQDKDLTVIGPSVQLDGNLECKGDLRVDGKIVGNVWAVNLLIGTDGYIEGEATADRITVRGHVKGPLRGKHIFLEAGAVVDGDLYMESVEIDLGAQISGTMRQSLEGTISRVAKRPQRPVEVSRGFPGSTFDTIVDAALNDLNSVRRRTRN